jgi:hypothetical protein
MTTSLTYGNVVDALLRRVPEFVDSGEQWYPDLPHDVFGTFAIWLCGLIAQEAGSTVIDRALALMNEMAESDDDEVVNLLEVSVLEFVADRPECLRKLETRLSGVARAHLDRVRQGGLMQ